MAEGAFLVIVLLFVVGAPLVLYALVRAEQDQRSTMDRRDAERVARRDTRDDTESRRP
jgi:multisubunit Na+/H+ antiporter MnhG subunit